MSRSRLARFPFGLFSSRGKDDTNNNNNDDDDDDNGSNISYDNEQQRVSNDDDLSFDDEQGGSGGVTPAGGGGIRTSSTNKGYTTATATATATGSNMKKELSSSYFSKRNNRSTAATATATARQNKETSPLFATSSAIANFSSSSDASKSDDLGYVAKLRKMKGGSIIKGNMKNMALSGSTSTSAIATSTSPKGFRHTNISKISEVSSEAEDDNYYSFVASNTNNIHTTTTTGGENRNSESSLVEATTTASATTTTTTTTAQQQQQSSIHSTHTSASDLFDLDSTNHSNSNTTFKKSNTSKSSGYTDVASLRKKHQHKVITTTTTTTTTTATTATTATKPANTLLSQKKQHHQQQKNTQQQQIQICSNSSEDNISASAEDLYGEGAGLGPTTQLKNLNSLENNNNNGNIHRAHPRVSSASGASGGGSYGGGGNGSNGKPNKSFVRSILPFHRPASVTSVKSKNSSHMGENESLLLGSLDGGIGGFGSAGLSFGTDMASAAAAVRHASMKPQRNFKKGDNVLIALSVISEDSFVPRAEDDTTTAAEGRSRSGGDAEGELREPTVAPVNKYGYPMGKGKKEEHKAGPHVYVIATVRKIHFKESARHYTVERADTGAWVRADTGWMEPIEAGSEAEKTAFEAAQIKEEDPEISRNGNTVLLGHTLVKSCYSSVRKSFFWFKNGVKKQASNFISGSNPYRCEISITTVNLTVLCSLIVAFLDQMKYAFFVKEADFSLSILQFIAWIVLIIELIFQLAVRPDDYSNLLKGTEACNPRTVSYINRFHLFFEVLALLLVVPDFLPIFGVESPINSVKASVYATVGAPMYCYIIGNLYFFTTRLRLFCLVRHKRNHWINALYLDKKDAKRVEFDVAATITNAAMNPRSLIRNKGSRNYETLPKNRKENSDDDLLPKAAKIGTALLLVNSHRIMMLLLMIVFAVPFLTSAAVGGPNKTLYQMTDYLHQLNNFTLNLGEDKCGITNSAIDGWLDAEHSLLDVNLDDEKPMVLWAQILPIRNCSAVSDGIITQCHSSVEHPYSCDKVNSVEGFEAALGLRRGSLIQDTRVDGEVVTTVIYNLSSTVSLACFNSFLLQSIMLLMIWLSLGFLRHDANQLVLIPLTKLLLIVLRYATNPLAPSPRDKKNASKSGIDDFGPMLLDIDDDSDEDRLGSYETEQLITAVKKITDLLRKCWGVAGAGIISSNLAKNMNTDTDTVVFNPTVPGKKVYALFGFVGINDFGHLLQCLDKEVMTLINDIAFVLHNEVYRWGLGDSGQCNKNLGGAFLMVFRIGDFDEVRQKNDAAKKVLFSNTDDLGSSVSISSLTAFDIDSDLNGITLASLPGINQFADRALLGFLKTFAGLNRDKNIKIWEKDYRVGGGVDAFSVSLSFGMDAGWAVEGAVGSSYKIDATYLSRHVNMAARMMSACKQYQLPILLSQAVEELLSNECRCKLRHVDTVYVKGSKAAQRIYTYDARHQGVSFFLNMRTDEQADREANNYSPKVWEKDQDLREMRGHISDDFLSHFKKGRDHYLEGRWPDAVIALEQANETMIADMTETGRIEVIPSMKIKLRDSKTQDEEAIHLRQEYGDGPSQTLISYIRNRNCRAPESWEGVRPLMSK